MVATGIEYFVTIKATHLENLGRPPLKDYKNQVTHSSHYIHSIGMLGCAGSSKKRGCQLIYLYRRAHGVSLQE